VIRTSCKRCRDILKAMLGLGRPRPIDRLQIGSHRLPHFPGHIVQRSPHYMDDAELHFGSGIDRLNGFRKSFEPIHATLLPTAVYTVLFIPSRRPQSGLIAQCSGPPLQTALNPPQVFCAQARPASGASGFLQTVQSLRCAARMPCCLPFDPHRFHYRCHPQPESFLTQLLGLDHREFRSRILRRSSCDCVGAKIIFRFLQLTFHTVNERLRLIQRSSPVCKETGQSNVATKSSMMNNLV